MKVEMTKILGILYARDPEVVEEVDFEIEEGASFFGTLKMGRRKLDRLSDITRGVTLRVIPDDVGKRPTLLTSKIRDTILIIPVAILDEEGGLMTTHMVEGETMKLGKIDVDLSILQEASPMATMFIASKTGIYSLEVMDA
jgi:hypothetical protein